MTNTMPVLTDEQRKELIDEIDYNRKNCFLSSKTKLLMQIAEAALTAEPAGNFAYHEDEDGDPTDFIIESDGFTKDSFKLYPAPPVPALKPVELPSTFSPAISSLLKGGTGMIPVMRMDDNGKWISKAAFITAMRNAGYELTE